MRWTIILLLLVRGAAMLFAQGPASADQGEVLRQLAYFSSLYPRTEGSAGEREAIAHIERTLQGMGVPYQERPLNDIEGIHSYSSSIEVFLKGRSPDELLVAVPIDQELDASRSDDGSINPALALGFIRELRAAEPPVSVRFLFLGAEYGGGSEYPIGSREFLANFYPDHPVAVLYLNFRFIPARTIIASGSNGTISPYWIINRCATSLDDAGLFYLLRGNENQIYRLGLAGKPPLIDAYLRAGYPAIELSDMGTPLPDSEWNQWVGTALHFFSGFVAKNAGGFPSSWDRHYLFFQARFFSFILSESEYIVLLVILMALAILYPLIHQDRFRRHFSTLLRHFLSLPLLLATIFAFLFASTYLVESIGFARNFPTLWRYAPFPFFALKVVAALFLFALLFKALRGLPFARNGRFYTAATLLLLLVDVVAVALVNISLTYYLVWAMMFAILFSILTSPYLKTLCLLASTGWLVKAGVDIFTLPALDAVRVVLLSPVKGNLFLSVVLLPFILMTIRVELLFRRHHPSRRRLFIRFADLLLGVATAGLFGYLMAFAPFGPRNPQPIAVQEEIDIPSNSRTVTLYSPAPIGKVRLITDAGAFEIATRSRTYTTSLPEVQNVLSIERTSSGFLDRRQIGLTLIPRGTPYEVTVILASAKELVIYDSNFPFSYNPTANEAIIHVGKNPPFPLSVEFTLPESGEVAIQVVMVYTALPYPLQVTGKDIVVSKRLVVATQLPAPE